MRLVVRFATPADRPALLEQSWQLNLHEDPISQDRRTDRPGAEDTLATQLEKVERSGGVALVAERGGAAARGLRQIMIGVLAGNGLAERAYLGYGFRPYATELVKTIGE